MQTNWAALMPCTRGSGYELLTGTTGMSVVGNGIAAAGGGVYYAG